MHRFHKVLATGITLVLASARVLAQQQPAPEPAPLDDAKVHAAVYPPELSLTLKDASPDDVVAALNKALGGTIVSGKGRGISRGRGVPPRDSSAAGDTRPLPRFTLTSDKVPLWEVLRQFDRQSDLGVQRTPEGIVLDFGQPSAGRPPPLNGELMKSMVSPERAPGLALRARIYNFLSDPMGQPQRWTFLATVMADPRTRICNALVEVASVTDDKGNAFELKNAGDASNRPPAGYVADGSRNPPGNATDQPRNVAPSAGSYRRELSLTRPGPGGNTAKVTGNLHVWVVLEEQTRDVGPLNDNLGKPIEMKGGTVTFRRIAGRGDPPMILTSSLVRAAPAGAEEWPVEWRTTSSMSGTGMAGLVGDGGRASGGSALDIPSGMLQVNWVLRAKEVVVPFEIADVALERP